MRDETKPDFATFREGVAPTEEDLQLRFISRLFETSEGSIDVVDAEGRILLSNEYQHRSTAPAPEGLCGRDWFDTVVVPEDRERLRTRVLAMPSGGRLLLEGAIQTPSRGRRHMRWSVSSLDDGSGGVIGHLLVGDDRTERVRLSHRLKRCEGLYHAIAEMSQEAMWTLDGSGTIESVNRAAELLHGRSRDQLVGAQLPTMVAEDDRHALENILSRSDRSDDEQLKIALVGASGMSVPLSASVRTFGSGGECFHVCVARKIECEQRGGQASGEPAEGGGGRIERLAHDLRSLFMGIDGCAALTREGLGKDSPLMRFVAQIRHSARRGQVLLATQFPGPRLVRASSSSGAAASPAFRANARFGGHELGGLGAGAGSVASVERRPRLLLVDDDDAVRLGLRHQLQGLGWEVLEAADGLRALELIENPGSVDGVALDVVLPGCMGVCVAREIHARVGDVPIVFMSGYPRGYALQEELVSDDCLFVEKPVDACALHEALSREGLARTQ